VPALKPGSATHLLGKLEQINLRVPPFPPELNGDDAGNSISLTRWS